MVFLIVQTFWKQISTFFVNRVLCTSRWKNIFFDNVCTEI